MVTAWRRLWLGMITAVSSIVLATLTLAGMGIERTSASRSPDIGTPAPGFRLPATSGGHVELPALRGHPVVLLFVPSVRCSPCQQQLRAAQVALPDVQAAGGQLLTVTVDPEAAAREVAAELGLTFPILSEAPTTGQHPAATAYGVYHLPQQHAGPVDAFAAFVIDATGLIRWRSISPDTPVPIPAVVTALREITR